MNEGKRFEENIKSSVPPMYFIYRLKDAGGWSKGDDLRFTPSNICDYFLMAEDQLYLIECKSLKTKSLPFSSINISHLRDMAEAAKKSLSNVSSFLFINFREFDATYAVEVEKIAQFLAAQRKLPKPRKSIPLDWAKANGFQIPQHKMRTNWRYDIEAFFHRDNLEEYYAGRK